MKFEYMGANWKDKIRFYWKLFYKLWDEFEDLM